MGATVSKRLSDSIGAARSAGSIKRFRVLDSPVGSTVRIDGRDVLLFASNDYLALANNPDVVAAGHQALDRYGAGTASARFISGTFFPHIALENTLADFLHCEEAITFSSCWAANTALIPLLAQDGDVILSDALNHASLIDGCRLASRGVLREMYPHSDMHALGSLLDRHRDARARFVLTDGVFSMEGDLAPLDDIVALARQHDAFVVVDDAHGIGTVGRTGRGTAEHFGVLGEIDVMTGSLGKALGGAAGGFLAGSTVVIEAVKQFGRPHIFSNAIPASLASSTHRAIELLISAPEMVSELAERTAHFRRALRGLSVEALDGATPIVPVILGETSKAMEVSERMFARGVFVTGLGYPVVPEGAARLRFQVSRSHTAEQLEAAARVLRTVLDEINAGPQGPECPSALRTS